LEVNRILDENSLQPDVYFLTRLKNAEKKQGETFPDLKILKVFSLKFLFSSGLASEKLNKVMVFPNIILKLICRGSEAEA